MGRRPYMVRILSTSPLEAVKPNLHRHPYTIIEPPDDRGSKSIASVIVLEVNMKTGLK